MPKRRKNSNRQSAPLLLLGGGFILLLIGFVMFSQNRTPAPSAPQTIADEIPYPEIARASIEDARAALDSGAAILLDVRSAEAFAAQRIAGAVNIPTAETQARLSELDPNAWIIPYCT